jgi:hypothetical protein
MKIYLVVLGKAAPLYTAVAVQIGVGTAESGALEVVRAACSACEGTSAFDLYDAEPCRRSTVPGSGIRCHMYRIL